MSKYTQRQVGFCNTCAWFVKLKYEDSIKPEDKRMEQFVKLKYKDSIKPEDKRMEQFVKLKYEDSIKPEDKRMEQGECHRYTPTIIVLNGYKSSVWPMTEQWMYCGEYTYYGDVYRGDDPISPTRK